MITKQAGAMDGFIQGAINSVANSVDFKNKPFESIFGLAGPFAVGLYSPVLGFLVTITQAFGYGPAQIGKLIDEHLKGTMKNGEVDSSDANLETAATKAINGIMGDLGGKAEADLEQICLIKKSLSFNDLVVVAHLNKYAKKPLSGAATSGAAKAGWWQKIKNTGYLKSVMGGVLALLKGSFKTLAIMGLVGGLYAAFSGKTTLPGHEPTAKQTEEQKTKSSNVQYYSNVANSVEDTLITFLDAAAPGFSRGFQSVNKHPLKGSPKMAQVLKQLEQENLTSIENLNGSKVFQGPKVIVLAKQLLPEAKFEEIGKPGAAKPATPSAKPAKTKNELHGLLNEVLK